MIFEDLRSFIQFLESRNQLKQINLEIDPKWEMTEISDRVIKSKGPALLFNHPKIISKSSALSNEKITVLTNLFGTPERVAMGIGKQSINDLREIGHTLAFLKEPTPPQNIKEAFKHFPLLKKVFAMKPKLIANPLAQSVVIEKEEINLYDLPIQTAWPNDIAPLITWGLTITKGPEKKRQNIGIYRQQLIGKNRLIMRWLAHRGGALDFWDFQIKNPGKPFPVVVAIGADPATILAAVTPIPDSLSEYAFAGLLRNRKTLVARSIMHPDLLIPANAEIVLEGFIYPNDFAKEGPYGDHTGYYNEVASFPVFTVEKLTYRKDPIYHSTHTGRPPDEPSMLGLALNEVFIPILQKQFPEIVDFYLPPEGCSYRLAVVSIKKQYIGHAKRVMFGIWSFLRQFMYTKFIVVVDDDINCRSWDDVIWAMTTRMDPARDTVMVENTPIDYLDFASPISGLGSKMGLDATNKWQGESNREWGEVIKMDSKTKNKIDAIWDELGI